MKRLFGKVNYKYSRFICPCCGYPTLDSKGEYDICIMCNWEDDGQGDEDADIVRGGPNGDYSLLQARINFVKYMCMYEPGSDMRIAGGDTPEELKIKKKLKEVYDVIEDYSKLECYKNLYKNILSLEEELNKLSRLKTEAFNVSVVETDTR